MSDDISLLPEELRKKEDELTKGTPPAEVKPGDLRFSIPTDDAEDIEVIEVDEGEVDQVLSSEPGVTKFLYRFTSLVEDFAHRLFQPAVVEPPPKRPPQFFTPTPPSSPRTVSSVPEGKIASAPAAVGEKSKSAILKPFPNVPKRVRVIRRVRKPVRVSFVSAEDLRLMHVDISKRRFTFIAICLLFVLLLGGGTFLMQMQAQAARAELAKANAQLADVRAHIQDRQSKWSSFQNLEPKLKALQQLLDQHISPTQLFDAIERHTLPTVFYSSFNLTSDRRVTLLATADSLTSAAGQVAAFERSGLATKVEANGYAVKYATPESSTVQSVDFQIILTLSDGALLWRASSASP